MNEPRPLHLLPRNQCVITTSDWVPRLTLQTPRPPSSSTRAVSALPTLAQHLGSYSNTGSLFINKTSSKDTKHCF